VDPVTPPSNSSYFPPAYHFSVSPVPDCSSNIPLSRHLLGTWEIPLRPKRHGPSVLRLCLLLAGLSLRESPSDSNDSAWQSLVGNFFYHHLFCPFGWIIPILSGCYIPSGGHFSRIFPGCASFPEGTAESKNRTFPLELLFMGLIIFFAVLY